VLTFVDPHHVRFVLSKVERLTGVYFAADGLMKIAVANRPVLINIEFVEDEFELLFIKVEAPMLQVEPEFFLFECPVPLLVNIRESFAYGLPLELNLIYDRFF
jgi:hypothetical protein